MIDVFNLAVPFFGLIFIGFAGGKIEQIPDTALGWMNFFIVYVSLPALFYRILAKTPLEQVARVDFVFAMTLATFWACSLSFGGRDADPQGQYRGIGHRRARRRLWQHRLYGAARPWRRWGRGRRCRWRCGC